MNMPFPVEETINAAIACIYADSKSIAGTGFAVTEKHVITCAHVINTALGRAADDHTKPPTDTRIDLAFPKAQSPELQQELNAKIVKWQPARDDFRDIEDIVVLEVDTAYPLPLPRLVNLRSNDYFDQRIFRVFGFNFSEGSWADGDIAGSVADNSVQLNMKQAVDHGFSGAPVWDQDKYAVIGMLVTMRKEQGLAYMIPLSVLLDVWPEMGETTLPHNPYRGLDVFKEQHQQDFFGREAVTANLVERVSETPFMLLMGTSGSGKSSLLNAGLITHLKASGDWLVLKTRPSVSPMKSLAKVLVDALYDDPISQSENTKALTEKLGHSIDLTDLCERALNQSRRNRLLLVVDQFEELYTNTPDQNVQQHYIDQLLSLVATGSVTLLLSLRADFIAQLMVYQPLTQVMNQYSEYQLILGGMSADELHTAIVKPAEQLGVVFEPGLVERILNELRKGDEGQLPLLEFALTQLWQRQHKRVLTHEALNSIGGIRQALALHAEQVMAKPELKEHLAAVERIMVQLIVPGAGKEDTRQIVPHDHFSAEDRWLLPVLANHRLVVTRHDQKTGGDTVEVIHEALIREWAAFRGWIEKHREFLVWQRRLRERQADWKWHRQENEGLLTGRYLLEAKEYLTSHEEMLSEKGINFIKQSAKVARYQKLTQQGIVAGVIGAIGLVAAVAVWQWKLALDAESLALLEAERALKAESNADFAAKKASKSETLAKLEAEKVKQAQGEANKLIQMMIESLPNEGRPIDYGKIEDTFQALIASKFNDAKTLGSYALLMYQLKRYKRSEKLYRKALEIDPNNSVNLGNLAFLTEKINKNYNEAEKLYIKSIDSDSKNTTNMRNFANFLAYIRKKYNKAEHIFEKVIKTTPNDSDSLGDFAVFIDKIRNNPAKAEKLYLDSIRADPKNANNLGNFANFMLNTRKDIKKAGGLFRQALNNAPKNAENLGRYAYFLEAFEENFSEAERYYYNAIATDSKNTNNLIRFANFMANHKKNYNKAKELYSQATKASPNNSIYLSHFANFTAVNLNAYDEAEKLYLAAIEKASTAKESTNALINFGKFLKSIRLDYKKAESNFQKALELEPKNTFILNYLAHLAGLLKEYDRAAKLYKVAISIDSKNTSSLTNFAILQEKVFENHKLAKDLYMKSYNIDPDNIYTLENYAIYLLDIESHQDMAENLYKKHLIKNKKPNLDLLNSYANFLTEIPGRSPDAHQVFEKLTDGGSAYDANHLCDFAIFKLTQGDLRGGDSLIKSALLINANTNKNISLKAWIYRFIYLPLKYPEAPSKIINIISTSDVDSIEPFFVKKINNQQKKNKSLLLENISKILTKDLEINSLSTFKSNRFFINGVDEFQKPYQLAGQAWRLYEDGEILEAKETLLKNIYNEEIENKEIKETNINNLAWVEFSHFENKKSAMALYNRVLEDSSDNTTAVLKMAQINLLLGKYQEGREFLKTSLSQDNSTVDSNWSTLEKHFLAYAHFPKDYPTSLQSIVLHLKKGVRSKWFVYDENIEQAKKQNHPNTPLLQALADVISNKAEFDTLKPFLQETETANAE